jgi:hypothetical protein
LTGASAKFRRKVAVAHEVKPVGQPEARPLSLTIYEAQKIVRRSVRRGRSLTDELMRERKEAARRE